MAHTLEGKDKWLRMDFGFDIYFVFVSPKWLGISPT
jgi:hypothetical protein